MLSISQCLATPGILIVRHMIRRQCRNAISSRSLSARGVKLKGQCWGVVRCWYFCSHSLFDKLLINCHSLPVGCHRLKRNADLGTKYARSRVPSVRFLRIQSALLCLCGMSGKMHSQSVHIFQMRSVRP